MAAINWSSRSGQVVPVDGRGWGASEAEMSAPVDTGREPAGCVEGRADSCLSVK